MLKLGIHMDNELLYCGIENLTPCSYSTFYLPIFLSFKAEFVSQLSPELCKLKSLNAGCSTPTLDIFSPQGGLNISQLVYLAPPGVEDNLPGLSCPPPCLKQPVF